MFEHRLGSERGDSSGALVPWSSDLVQESLKSHCQRGMETLTGPKSSCLTFSMSPGPVHLSMCLPLGATCRNSLSMSNMLAIWGARTAIC